MDLRKFLSYFDFDYDIVSPGGAHEERIRRQLVEDGSLSVEESGKDLICLIDLQGAYWGGIGNERYLIAPESVEQIIARMDIYVHDYVIDEFEEALEDRGVDHELLSLGEMIERCRSLGVGDGEVCYELAEAVANPESITIKEVAELENGLYDVGVLARHIRDMMQSFYDLNNEHWDNISVRMPIKLAQINGFGLVVQTEQGDHGEQFFAVSIYKDFTEKDNGFLVLTGSTEMVDMDQLEKVLKDSLVKLKAERGSLEDKIRGAEGAQRDVGCKNASGKDFER